MRITIYNLDNDDAEVAVKMGGHICKRRDEGYDIEFALSANRVKLIQLDESHLLLIAPESNECLQLADYNFGEITIV